MMQDHPPTWLVLSLTSMKGIPNLNSLVYERLASEDIVAYMSFSFHFISSSTPVQLQSHVILYIYRNGPDTHPGIQWFLVLSWFETGDNTVPMITWNWTQSVDESGLLGVFLSSNTMMICSVGILIYTNIWVAGSQRLGLDQRRND